MISGMKWTPELKDELAGYLRKSMSARQIGEAMNLSRNAVISAVNRNPALKEIGFDRKSGENMMMAKPKPVKKRKPKPEPKPAIVIQLFEAPVEPVPDRYPTVGLPLALLRPRQCQWAVNDAEGDDLHLFCAMPSNQKPYCDHHMRLAYRKPEPKQRAAA